MEGKRDKFPTSPEVDAFKQTILKTAEDLFVNKFPKKIVQLNKMLSSGKLTCEPSSVYQKINIPVPDVSAPVETGSSSSTSQQTTKTSGSSARGQAEASSPKAAGVSNGETGPSSAKRRFAQCPAHPENSVVGTKVLVLPDGVVPCNKFIVELIGEIKPLIGELVEDTNLLKMWLMYLIPRIEDGNNFGVSIQEDVLGEIRASEGESAAYYDQISRYFALRGKTVAKIAQYPHIDDYRRAIQELDEKEFFSLRLIVAELRNHYATLHDLISKNGDKIRKPRSSNAQSMF